jgi:hypothetical protein
MANKFMAKLLKNKGAVVGAKNAHGEVIRSPSPSFNFTFGNAQGLPAGYTMLLYGPPRGGKSVICNSMAGQLHKDDPDAWVIKINTEYREAGQADEAQQKMYGIDPERYAAFERNDPEIFDFIEYKLPELAAEGMKVKLVIIDSLNQIQGRRGSKEDATIMTQQIGDNSLTIQEGLKRILPIQRQLKFGLILTTHIRSQMDTKQRGSSAIVSTSYTTAVKPAASFGALHHAEYFVYIEPDNSKDGKMDILGGEFLNKEVEDMMGNNEKTGHRIKVKMMDNSVGPKGRAGEFTFDYKKGIINTHEEVFLLGLGQGIITKPNNMMYAFDGMEWKGKEAAVLAFKDDQVLQRKVLEEIQKRDMAHLHVEPSLS